MPLTNYHGIFGDISIDLGLGTKYFHLKACNVHYINLFDKYGGYLFLGKRD